MQAEVALLHEVGERQPGVAVAAGHPDDEAQVGPHEAVAGFGAVVPTVGAGNGAVLARTPPHQHLFTRYVYPAIRALACRRIAAT